MCSNFTCIIHHCGLREYSDNQASDKDLHVTIILGKLRQFTWLPVVSSHRKYETLEIYLCSQSWTFLASHKLILLWSFTYLQPLKDQKKMGPTREQAQYNFGDSWGYSFHEEIKTSSAVNFPYSQFNCQLCIIYKFQGKHNPLLL